MRRLPVGVFLAGLSFWMVATASADTSQGEAIYAVCAGCHGFRGEGGLVANAPGLAGQEPWYLTRQLENFLSGARGGERDDAHGKTMGTMAKALQSDSAVANVVSYIGTLPVAPAAATVRGDSGKGKQLYAACAACHGAAAEGNKAMSAPALAMMNDWYVAAQLRKFKAGQRGAVPGDTYGQQMMSMTASLADEQAINDVVSYIHSLGE